MLIIFVPQPISELSIWDLLAEFFLGFYKLLGYPPIQCFNYSLKNPSSLRTRNWLWENLWHGRTARENH